MGCSVYLVSLSRYTQPHTGANMSVFSWLKCDQKTLMLLFGFYQKMSVFDLLSKSVRRKRFVPNGTITYYSQSLICFRNVSVKAGAYLAFLIQKTKIYQGLTMGFITLHSFYVLPTCYSILTLLIPVAVHAPLTI